MTESPGRPTLIFFTSTREGRSRRAEGFLAQVLQRRRNHDTFSIHRIPREERPDLHEKFRVAETPTLVILEDKHVRGRLRRPRGCAEIERFLAPWLK
jgi:hypothetical protein